MMTQTLQSRPDFHPPHTPPRQPWQPQQEAVRREWSRAACLAERLEAHRQRGSLPRLQAGALARGYRPEQQWRAQAPFASLPVFLRRLEQQGLDEQEFRAILGGAAAPAAEGEQAPGWLAGWLAAFWRDAAVTEPPASPEVAALQVLEPALATARARLRTGIARLLANYRECPFDATTAETLLMDLLRPRLARIAAPVFLLELENLELEAPVASRGETLLRLVRRYGRRERALELFRRYPLLARQLSEALEAWVETGLAFLDHLAGDWPQLRSRFGGEAGLGALVALAVADNGADLVAFFGCDRGLVYRPRPVAVDRHFQELLAWLNRRGLRYPLRELAVLDLEDHGWLEFAEDQECAEADLARRHWRQGAYLALLYALDAAPATGEALVLAGEHPVLTDAALLFQARLPGFAPQEDVAETLPDRAEGYADHAEELDVGFVAVYGLLLTGSRELLAADGPLTAFAQDPLHFRLRPRDDYLALLTEACAPEVQRDALERDRLFDRLWLAVEHAPALDPLVPLEQAELRRGRLPAFHGTPGSRDLEAGACRLPEILAASPLERMCRRLARSLERLGRPV